MSNAGGNSLDDQYPGYGGPGMNMDDIDMIMNAKSDFEDIK